MVMMEGLRKEERVVEGRQEDGRTLPWFDARKARLKGGGSTEEKSSSYFRSGRLLRVLAFLEEFCRGKKKGKLKFPIQ